MSYTNVVRSGNTRGKVDYELFGAKDSKRYWANKKEGTNRVAAMRSNIAALGEDDRVKIAEAFVEKAEAVARAHGRKIESRSIIQSFEKDELAPTVAADVQRVNDLGYMLAKGLHPDSDCLIITHVDGPGGHPHNHIKVINHDNATGKALRKGDRHFELAKINDALMKKEGQRVLQHGARPQDHYMFWETRREGDKVGEFDKWLGDTTLDCLMDTEPDEPVASDEGFERFVETWKTSMLAMGDIKLTEKVHTIKASADGTEPEHESIGWTYSAPDRFSDRKADRRRKASSLSDDHTSKGVRGVYELKVAVMQKQIEQEQQRAALEQRSKEHGSSNRAVVAEAGGGEQRVDLADELFRQLDEQRRQQPALDFTEPSAGTDDAGRDGDDLGAGVADGASGQRGLGEAELDDARLGEPEAGDPVAARLREQRKQRERDAEANRRAAEQAQQQGASRGAGEDRRPGRRADDEARKRGAELEKLAAEAKLDARNQPAGQPDRGPRGLGD